MNIEGYAASETGPVREHNEDAWLVDVDGGLFVVADGMGGHAAGEVSTFWAGDAARSASLLQRGRRWLVRGGAVRRNQREERAGVGGVVV